MERGDAGLKDITQEEVSKLTRAMKDRQFQNHMDDYCKEISDPRHRKEYLQYLDQLEAKGEIPDGQCLLRTEPGCCVKTTIKFKNGQIQKCFINIVHSDRLEDMSEQPDENGGKGKRVHMPYSLSPPRPERDNKDENCMTCDFAVSTWTFGQAIQRPNVLKMLVDTASEGLTSQFLKGHEEVKKDFKVMRRIRCRGPGGRPVPMSVKAELMKDKGTGKHKPVYSSVTEQSAVTPSELKQMRADAKEKMLKPPKPQDDDDEEVVATKLKEDAQESVAGRIRVPKHKLVHSGVYDLTDFMEASNRPTVLAQSIPRMLKLIVELPTVKKVGDISLEVTKDNVCIEVPDKYYLDLPLSYEIDEDNGDAKFDKVKQVLTLELPVKPKPPDPNLLANRGGLPTEGDTVESESEGALSEGENQQDDLPPLEDVSADPPAPEPQLSPSSPKESQREALQPPAAANLDLVSEEDLPGFIPSNRFDGARQGYYFGTGDEGLGYYRDKKQRRPEKEKPASIPGPEKLDENRSASLDTMDDAAPLIEEIDASDFISASASGKAPVQKPQLSLKLQQYLDASTLLTSPVAAADIGQTVDTEPLLELNQTRQNILLFIGVQSGHEVAGLQLSFHARRMTISFCTRAIGEARWRRHHLRRTILRMVDTRQWHADPPKRHTGEDGDASILIVLRKAEQERWPEVFDTSAAALAADAEPIVTSSVDVVASADAAVSQAAADNTAAADTAAGADVDVAAEDSAELDIAAPTGAPVALGPTELSIAKDKSTLPGTSAPVNAAAANAAAQSASVMGQAVLLQNRMMYQLF